MYIHHLIGHESDFQNIEIIAEKKNFWRTLIIEGLEIHKLGENKVCKLKQDMKFMSAAQSWMQSKYDLPSIEQFCQNSAFNGNLQESLK